MTKTFRKKTAHDSYFFAYCEYRKISDIRRLSDSNHRAIEGLSNGNNRVIDF